MPEYAITRSFELPLPLDGAWLAMSDTARVNLEAGNPSYRSVEEVQPDGSALRRSKGAAGALKLEWEESFGQWVHGRWALQERSFRTGPLSSARFGSRLVPVSPGRTRVEIEGAITWHGLVGTLLHWAGFMRKFVDQRVDLVQRLGEARAAAGGSPPALAPPRLGAEAERRLQTALAALRGRRDPKLVAALESLLRGAVETDLARIRPLALAAAWQAPAAAVIALVLDAHREGLLGMRWELLCPRCRGGKAAVGNLYELPRGTHCPSCNIDYERDFTRNVELVFRPEPWLRPLADGEYCLLGPATTPHVRVQHRLSPGESVELEAELAPGAYRLRSVEEGPERDIDWSGEAGFPEVVLTPEAVTQGPPAPPGRVRLRNDGPVPRFAVIEDRQWLAEVLTGDRVLALPAFRELCPEQVIRPGDEVAISRACVLFADLKGSTALYARLGDAAAYGLVRDYFAFFAERLTEAGGVLVKTMGDAVMAAFAEPEAAVATALAIHRDAAAFSRQHGGDALVSKIGLHAGPCVAVNTSGLMDYFGRTVNLAARLQAQSDGSDIVLTRAMAEDPAVAALIAGMPARDEVVQLRGIPEPTEIRRVQVEALATDGAEGSRVADPAAAQEAAAG
ncbi:adenylate/guanylate cyclase domain-containing protein [Marinibaculum pumilum]|uniref:Adenylate/guanylate cyclase domain-containing protein n=1 Tax=Marinibaculum pumilum TaxID=1766165 RepID=A0ABV7KVA3_9PROT